MPYKKLWEYKYFQKTGKATMGNDWWNEVKKVLEDLGNSGWEVYQQEEGREYGSWFIKGWAKRSFPGAKESTS